MADETLPATDQPAPAKDQPAPQTSEKPTEPTPGQPEPNGDPKPAEKKYALKNLKGQAVELTEAELVKLAQKGFGADQTFMAAATARKRAEQLDALEERIKAGDKKAALTALGLDPDMTAEEIMAEKWRQESMPAEQRELLALKAEHEKTTKELQTFRQQQEQTQADADVARQQQAYLEVISTAIETAGDLPKNGHTIARYAQYIQEAIDQGVQVTIDQLTALVGQDYHAQQAEFIKHVTPDKLAELLGDEYLTKLREADISRLEKGRAVNNAKPGTKPRKQEDPPINRKTYDQILRETTA